VSIGDKIEADDLRKITIPKTIGDVVLRRIEDLQSNSQKVIKYAAILLRDFTYELMERLIHSDASELSKVLWELKKRQILVEQNNRYHFYHATLREAVCKRLGHREKRKLNHHVGQIVECINKKNLSKVIEDLALYFINARDRKKGVFYGLKAAKKSSMRHANEQAMQFYKGVIDLIPYESQRQRFDVLQKLAQIENFIGRYDSAHKHYNAALNLKVATIEEKVKICLGIASIYGNKIEYTKALPMYQRASRIVKKMQPGKLKILLEANVHLRISRAYLQLGDYNRASQIKLEVLHLLKGLRGNEALRLQGSIYEYIGAIEFLKGKFSETSYSQAIIYFIKAYAYYKKINAYERIITIFIHLGNSYTLNRAFHIAVNYYKKAIRLADKIGDYHGATNSIYNLGVCYQDRGYYLEAVECYQKTIPVAKKTDNYTMIGFSFIGLGACYLKLNKYQDAKNSYERALHIFETKNWKEKKVYSVKGAGELYHLDGYCTEALRCYRKVLKIFKSMGNKYHVADVLIDISSVYISIGNFPAAKRFISEVLKIATDIEAEDIQIECFLALCEIYLIVKDYSNAYVYYQKGFMLVKNLRMRQHESRLFLYAAEIYYHRGKYLTAMNMAQRVLICADKMGTKDLYVEALLMKVRSALELGKIAMRDIIKTMDEAIHIAEEIKHPEVLWKTYFEYGNILQGNHHYRKALDYYQKCIEVFMNMSSKIKSKSYRKSYLTRTDRQAVFAAVDSVEKMIAYA
jgi:tetratricopeptide (TPR) repeat protein